MVLVGSVLSHQVDPRVLVTIGLVLTAAGNLLMGEASGLYAVIRSLGSSVGIAIVGWLVVSRTQAHWHVLAAGVTPFNPAATAYLAPLGLEPSSAAGTSLLAAELARQAQLLAYLDVFRLLGLTALAMLPIVLITQRPSGAAPVRVGTDRRRTRDAPPGESRGPGGNLPPDSSVTERRCAG